MFERFRRNRAQTTLSLFILLATLVGGARLALAAGLWIPNGGDIAEFQGNLRSGTTAAHRLLTSASSHEPSGIAFDKHHNLWSTNFTSSTLTEFPRKSLSGLKKNPSPAAAVIISDSGSGDLFEPEGLAFDKSQDLWVGAEGSGEVLEYTPGQVGSTGNPLPNIILDGKTFLFSSPSDVLFDKKGNLWVIDEDIANHNGGFGEIYRYDASQVAQFTAGINEVDPAFGLGIAAFQHIEGAAFDAKGNLWIADEDGGSVYKFLAANLTGSGLDQNPTPAVILGGVAMNGQCTESIDAPYGLAIDAFGNLYVVNDGETGPDCFGSLAKFSAKSIAKSGNPTPKVYVSSNSTGSNIDFSGYPAFGPTVP